MNGEIASELAPLKNIPIQPVIIELDEDIAVTDSCLWGSWADFVNPESGLGCAHQGGSFGFVCCDRPSNHPGNRRSSAWGMASSIALQVHSVPL